MPEYDDIMRILIQNANKGFVKRILNPESYPTLNIGDGNYATHKMAWEEIDTPEGKKYIVFPTVLYDGEKLVDFGDKALDTVMETGNYIEFDDPQKADWFSKQYKKVWGD